MKGSGGEVGALDVLLTAVIVACGLAVIIVIPVLVEDVWAVATHILEGK
jgi:hypothetical protein